MLTTAHFNLRFINLNGKIGKVINMPYSPVKSGYNSGTIFCMRFSV